jgi:hypothetical protein
MELAADMLRLEISNQIDAGLKRRNHDNHIVEITFESYKDPETGLMVASSIETALNHLGIKVHSEDIIELYTSRGLNVHEGLEFQDFNSIVCMPSPIEEWVGELHLSKLVADAMPRIHCCSKDQLRHLSRTTRQQVAVLCDVIKEYLSKMLEEHLATLERVYAELDSKADDDSEASDKFQIVKMNVGSIDDFHEGLVVRIGMYLSTRLLDQTRHICAFFPLLK